MAKSCRYGVLPLLYIVWVGVVTYTYYMHTYVRYSGGEGQVRMKEKESNQSLVGVWNVM